MPKTSAKQRVECFQANLPTFLRKQADYEANRKTGTRPAKSEYRKLVLTIKNRNNAKN